MSRRIDKKKQKKQIDTTPNNSPSAAASIVPVSAAAPSASAVSEQVDFFIQYKNQEYLEKDIIEKIKEKCKAEGIEITAGEKLSVYLKPEDGKAYFTYPGINGFVEV